MRVLIAEDDDNFRTLITEVLEQAGHTPMAEQQIRHHLKINPALASREKNTCHTSRKTARFFVITDKTARSRDKILSSFSRRDAV